MGVHTAGHLARPRCSQNYLPGIITVHTGPCQGTITANAPKKLAVSWLALLNELNALGCETCPKMLIHYGRCCALIDVLHDPAVN
jgi:hypothetical protein